MRYETRKVERYMPARPAGWVREAGGRTRTSFVARGGGSSVVGGTCGASRVVARFWGVGSGIWSIVDLEERRIAVAAPVGAADELGVLFRVPAWSRYYAVDSCRHWRDTGLDIRPA